MVLWPRVLCGRSCKRGEQHGGRIAKGDAAVNSSKFGCLKDEAIHEKDRASDLQRFMGCLRSPRLS